jgi:Zn finger protein HypA/HybF involved in hydrogenase expression
LSDNILDFPVEHIVQEVICIRCKKRFIDVRPTSLWLKDCVCPKCHKKGFLIATGQILDDEDMDSADK